MSSLGRNFTKLMVTLIGVLIFLAVLSVMLGKSANAAESPAFLVPVGINAPMLTRC